MMNEYSEYDVNGIKIEQHKVNVRNIIQEYGLNCQHCKHSESYYDDSGLLCTKFDLSRQCTDYCSDFEGCYNNYELEQDGNNIPDEAKSAELLFKELGFKHYKDITIGYDPNTDQPRDEELLVYEYDNDILRYPPTIKFNLVNKTIKIDYIIQNMRDRDKLFTAITKQTKEFDWV